MSDYLIWSHEHRAWWGPARQGYRQRLSEAGRYPHDEAVAICADSIAGTAARWGALPELPVALADIESMVAIFDAEYPRRPRPEPWE